MSDSAGAGTDPLPHAFDAQRHACVALGSTIAARMMTALHDDYTSGGNVHRLMAGRFPRPVHDAAPLRLLGGLHRLVLSDLAPGLGRHFPTSGGRPGNHLEVDTIETVAAHLDVLDHDLDAPVQTNDIGRSVVHMALCGWLGRRGCSDIDLVEVGSSAGLNLNFMHYGADTGAGTMGDPDSPIVFPPEWFDVPPPVVGRQARAARVVGSDPSPIDATTEAGALRLLSFVWPDHLERFDRLRAAIDIARRHPPDVRGFSADEAVAEIISLPLDRTTVVFHSITWQYMARTTQDAFVAELNRIGKSATTATPLVWARMEPAGAVADIRATIWNGSGEPTEHTLGTVGYHGRGMRWSEPSV